jgi:ABC-type dipeptide/oligopeptide/nickel transport system ATPase subunit
MYSVYFAPRGRERLLRMGDQLGHLYLGYDDKLIGIVGDSGSGKSLILKGMFPGIDLSNDDDGLDIHKVMQVRSLDNSFRNATYHIDMRFQLAFTQMYEIVNFVQEALNRGRRIIIEHFDLIYPYLNINADLLLGIGEEIIVTRPNIFGPLPQDIKEIVMPSLQYRRMAHTVEDLTDLILIKDYGYEIDDIKHGDVRGGFILNFKKKPELDIEELENKVKKLIEMKLDISYKDDTHISIGEHIIKCTGPRIHVRNTEEIKYFTLLKEFKYDSYQKEYSLVGLVRDNREKLNISDLNKITKSDV